MKRFGPSHLVTLLTSLSIAVPLLFLGCPGSAAQDRPARDLNGTWVSADPDRGAFVRIVIDGTTVHPYGACRPSGCDWGVIAGRIYCASVGSSLPVGMVATAVTNFDEVVITLLLEPDGSLRVDSFTHFTDGSRRADYHALSYLVRAGARN
jgi:hypothetical protein